MKTYSIITYLLIALVLSSVSLLAQDSKMYHNVKYGMFTEWSFGPTSLVKYDLEAIPNSTEKKKVNLEYEREYGGMSLINLIYTFRYNIYDHSDELSIGLNASPSLGISWSDEGVGTINLPGYVTANFGAGANYNSASNLGGYIGLGYEFNVVNVVSFWEDESYSDIPSGIDRVTLRPQNMWSQPMIVAGVRWWGNIDYLREVSLKYGFGSNDSDIPSGSKKPYSIQLSYGMMLNY